MDFRRIDKNTVQCILSEEEMSAYGFRIEDFFSNQEKAREFLEHLVERAEEEIGYEAHSGMVSMQIMKLPDNGIVITLSERDNSADGFQNMLQNIHQQLASILGPEAADQLMEQEGVQPWRWQRISRIQRIRSKERSIQMQTIHMPGSVDRERRIRSCLRHRGYSGLSLCVRWRSLREHLTCQSR